MVQQPDGRDKIWRGDVGFMKGEKRVLREIRGEDKRKSGARGGGVGLGIGGMLIELSGQVIAGAIHVF